MTFVKKINEAFPLLNSKEIGEFIKDNISNSEIELAISILTITLRYYQLQIWDWDQANNILLEKNISWIKSTIRLFEWLLSKKKWKTWFKED